MKAALAASERARAILQAMVDANPGHRVAAARAGGRAEQDRRRAGWRSANADEALKSFEAAFALISKLAAANPANARLAARSRDQHSTRSPTRSTLVGRRTEALANYRKSLAIVEALTKSDATNLQWQSDVAFAQTRIGMLLAVEGRREEALAAYRQGGGDPRSDRRQAAAETATAQRDS